ncbi:MAG TPA: hypothetical protein VMJ70_10505 [Candidatus Sulfotelmatobacter sp.]|nr:hypothetical protein [Candidatus Sulfotelmatobacter sp.]
MRVSDRDFARLRRAQILTGVVPLGLFLISHLAVNSRALAGPAAYQRAVEAIAHVPMLGAIELLLIALPIATHIALAAWLATARQLTTEPAWPSEAWRVMQRVTGFYLSIYVVFHVWAIRLSPERLAAKKPLFELMSAQLAHPVVWILQALAVITAAAHFAGGLVALTGPAGFSFAPRAQRVVRRAAIAGGALLALLGLASLAAFVWPAARWLPPAP